MKQMELPAVLGGPPALDRAILPSWPALADAAALEDIRQALEAGKWQMGPRTAEFEKTFAEYCGARHALLVTNCTQALGLSLQALGVEPGDEVILPAIAFISDLTIVMLLGAKPVLADVDPETGNISPEGIAEALTPKTKAILTLPYSGLPCDITAIMDLAARRGVPVVEDAAHAHGSAFRGRRIGAWATASCFSFDQNKVVSAGQGGAITTDDEALYKKLKRLRAFGQNPELTVPEYLFYTEVSGNYKPTDLQAILLGYQLAALDGQIAVRERQYQRICRALEEFPGLRPVIPTPGTERLSHYMMRFHYDCESWGGLDRNLLIKAFLKDGIPVGPGWTPLYYRLEAYAGGRGPEALPEWWQRLPHAENNSRRTLTLGMNLLMAGDAAVEQALQGFRKIYRHASEIYQFYQQPENRVTCRLNDANVLAGYDWIKGNPVELTPLVRKVAHYD
ncbi:MAG: DegT/DnrJ/EryC1/StrS family aminotransferase [Thermodesulfobacteriota bacterium]